MDGQQSTRGHFWRPTPVIGPRHGTAVAAVDEKQRQRRGPMRGDHRRGADDQHDSLLQARRRQRPAGPWEGVHTVGRRVDDLRVMVLPTGLVLFGAAVVVNGEQGRCQLLSGGAQIDRRPPAVGPDLQQRFPGGRGSARFHRSPVKGLALVVGHEAPGLAGQLEQPVATGGHAHGSGSAEVARARDRRSPQLTGDAGATVQGRGQVLGMVGEEDLVEDDELAYPQHPEGPDECARHDDRVQDVGEVMVLGN